MQVVRVLRVVDGWLRHECVTVHLRLRRALWADWLSDHIRAHSSDVIARGRPGAEAGLWSVTPRPRMRRMGSEYTIGNRRRRRGSVVPDVGEWRLALEMRRKHLGIQALGVWWSAVLIILFLLVGAAVEVGRPLVLIWPTVLSCYISSSQLIFLHFGTYIGVARDQVAHIA